MATTVKITNILTTTISDATGVEAVISPTGITKPCTPIQEYVSDMATIVDGTLLVPAYNKVQMLSIPFGAYTEFDVEDPKEVNYWENIKVNGAKIEVTAGNLKPSVEYTYTAVTFTNTGTTEEPVYTPAYAANTFYEVEGNDYVVVSSEPEDWGTAVDKYFTRKKNVLPTNNVDGE